MVKDFEKRPKASDLLNHPFLSRVADKQEILEEKIKKIIYEHSIGMFNKLNKPSDSTTKHLKYKSKRKSKRYSPHLINDLAKLEKFDEETIVAQLFHRYMQGHIYTYIGDILLAINPFTRLEIYNEEVYKYYLCYIM